MSDTPGYRFYKWTIILTPILALLVLLFAKPPFAWILLLLAAAFALCSTLERKYIPGCKRHLVSLILVGFSLIAAVLFFAGSGSI